MKMSQSGSNWQMAKVKNLAEYITVGFVGSMSSLFVEDGVPLLRGQNIHEYSLNLTNLKYISQETHTKWKKSALMPGDVVIVRVGYPGTACVIPNGIGELNAASLVIVRPDPKKLDANFLCYVINSPWGKAQVSGRLVGAAQQVFNTQTAAELEISCPPLPTQQRIAGILSAYDELIENSQKRIKILESMARTLYREWFVHFRFPGHESIPLVPSALGDIPQGWEVKKLGQIAENFDRLRKPLSKMQRVERQGDYPYYGAAKVFDYVNDFIFDGEYLLMAEDGSVITTERNPVLQLVNEKFWPNNHTHVLRGKMPVSTHFLYLGLSQVDISPYITGSAQPKITQENMNRIPFFCGHPIVHEEFNRLVEPMIWESQLRQSQIQNLRRTRDLLLPRLLSGQIDVFRQDEEGAA